MVVQGHFDGQRIILDEPAPPGIPPNAPVVVSFGDGELRDLLDEIAALAVDDDLLTDYSEQLDHYVKGTPLR